MARMDDTARLAVEGVPANDTAQEHPPAANENAPVRELEALASLPGYVYLGTAYSKYVGGLDRAAIIASRAAAALMRRGLRVFCPIAHSHAVAFHGRLNPLDPVLWMEQDGPLVDAASSLVVLMMDGWGESVGLAHEIEAFIAAHKPIVYVTEEELGL